MGIELANSSALEAGRVEDADCALICRSKPVAGPDWHNDLEHTTAHRSTRGTLLIHRRWIHVVRCSWCQCATCGLEDHRSLDDSHEAAVESTLVARDLVVGPHRWKDLGTRQVILDLDWERPKVDDLRNVTSHPVLCA